MILEYNRRRAVMGKTNKRTEDPGLHGGNSIEPLLKKVM